MFNLFKRPRTTPKTIGSFQLGYYSVELQITADEYSCLVVTKDVSDEKVLTKTTHFINLENEGIREAWDWFNAEVERISAMTSRSMLVDYIQRG